MSTVIPFVAPLAEALGDNPRPGMTVATAHPPFGYAKAAAGGVLHRVNRVVLVWRGGQVERVIARWSCKGTHGGSRDARLVRDPSGYRWCARCDIGNSEYGESLLYVALIRGGLPRIPGPIIKVGFTAQFATRMRALGAEPLATVPGGPVEEKLLLDAVQPFSVYGNEWLSLDCLPAVSETLGVPISLPDEAAS